MSPFETRGLMRLTTESAVRACEYVEQIGRRRRVRPVVERQIDGWGRALRHVPDGASAGDRVEEERRGRRVGERQDAGTEGNPYPHSLLKHRRRFVTLAT